MNPSFSTRRIMTDKVFSKSKLVHNDQLGGGCPQGLVPIQRTKVDDGIFHTYASKLPGEYVSFYIKFLSFMIPEKT